jgi:hypothetical protein
MNATVKRLTGTALLTGAVAAAAMSAGAPTAAADVSGTAAAPCASRVVPVRTYALAANAVKLQAGDRDFGKAGPAVTTWGKLEKWTVGSPGSFHDELRVRFGLRADETKSNWTRGRWETTVVLYRAPSGCFIDSGKLPGTFDSNGYLAQRPRTPEPYKLGAGDTGLNSSFVNYYRVWAQHGGKDVGSYTRMQVTTKSFRVYFTG